MADSVMEMKIVHTVEVPSVEYLSERWEETVLEHVRLGRSRDEAECFVNAMLTNSETLPAEKRGTWQYLGIVSIPPNE